ncbi:MAG: hypothetical protein KAH32_08230 [Chlamydiia bacterium]|nr:hypothetical protein [Chlamydiia bacterium]
MKEIKAKVPGAAIQYSGPVIQELLDELKKIHAINGSVDINEVMKDPLAFAKKLLGNVVNEKSVFPDKLIDKVIPMVPVQFVQDNAKGIKAALKIIIGDGTNLDSILSEVLVSNPTLVTKLEEE